MKVPLDISHKPLLTELFRKLSLQISEYSFANLWLFRNKHHYQVLFDEMVFIEGQTYDKKRYLMPTGDLRTIRPETLIRLASTVDCFFPIPESWVADLQQKGFKASFVEADSDYLFSRKKLIELHGRHLAGQRNLIHHFRDRYENIHLAPLNDDAYRVLQIWKEKNEEDDFEECHEALEKRDELNLTGFVLYADGKPCGFVIGEYLPSAIFCIHFAKADVTFQGVYPYLFQSMAMELPEDIEWLNWEQDLGDAHLHQAKQAYQPEILLKKWRLSYLP